MANRQNSAASSGTPVAPNVDPATPVAQTTHQNDQSPVLTKHDDPKPLPGNGASEVVEKITVKTKDDGFILMDPFSARHIGSDPVEVPVTSFITDELEDGGRLEKA